MKQIHKGFLSALGTVLLSWALAAIPGAAKWVFGLILTDSQIFTVRLVSGFLGLGLLGLVGWILFYHTRRKLQSVQQRLDVAMKERSRFQDECTFDKKLGVYRHKTNTNFFCASCTPKGIESPMKEFEHGWQCQIKGCEKWFDNPDNPTPPYAPMPKKSNWMDI